MKPFPIVKGHHYFEAQEKGESVIAVTRKHWLSLTSPFVIASLTAIVLLVFSGMVFATGEKIFGDFDNALLAVTEVLILLYIILAAFSTWLIRYLNVIILTNKHLVDVSQKAFFARSISTLALQDIEDVTIDKHGFLQTIFDFGNLKIQTAGELPNFELKSIADPETVQRRIMEAKASRENISN
jgi:branched-subunit amino acid transport protein